MALWPGNLPKIHFKNWKHWASQFFARESYSQKYPLSGEGYLFGNGDAGKNITFKIQFQAFIVTVTPRKHSKLSGPHTCLLIIRISLHQCHITLAHTNMQSCELQCKSS